MESEIKSSYEIRTYHPTEDEFSNFWNCIEKYGSNDCFAKVVPPHKFESKSIRRCIPLNMVFEQNVANRVLDSSGKPMAYNLSYDYQIKMKYGDLHDIGVKTDAKYASLTFAEHENLFWQGIRERTNQSSFAPLYSIDNEFSLFPRIKETCWDLSKFTASQSLIHQPDMEPIPGIHTPYAYVGNNGTSFGFHKEDSDLCSINYLHDGKPKCWYGVPDSETDELEQLISEIAKKLNINCTQYARHKNLMIPPSVLSERNIKFTRIVQMPGEYVISFSGGYHQGFNIGLNTASAVNFADRRWLNFYSRFETCVCPDYSKNTRNVHALIRPVFEKFNNVSLEHEVDSGIEKLVGIDETKFNKSLCEPLSLIEAPNNDLFFGNDQNPAISAIVELANEPKTYTAKIEKIRNESNAGKQSKARKQHKTMIDRKPFKCDLCYLTFAHQRGLNEHKRYKHSTMIIRYVCSECESSFCTPYLWRKHLSSTHNIIKSNNDAVNFKNRKRNSKRMQELYAAKQKYIFKREKVSCPDCNKMCSGSSNLKRHINNSCKGKRQ